MNSNVSNSSVWKIGIVGSVAMPSHCPLICSSSQCRHSLLVSFSCWFLLSWQPHRIFQRSASDSAPEVRLPFLCAVQTLPGVLLHCWQVMGSMTSSPHHRRHRRAEREQLSLLSNQRSSFVSSVAVPSHGSLTRSSSQCRRSPYPEGTTSSFMAFLTQTHPKNSDSEEI